MTHAGGATREVEFDVLEDPPGMVASTRGRGGGGHVLAVTTNPAPGSPVARTPQQARDVIGGRLEPGDPATVDRLAAIVSARTKVPSPEVARRALQRARETGFDELLRRHRAAWDAAWSAADLRVDGDAADQHALRFAIYHMISTAHPGKDTVSIGARGLGGMSYFLHVFWDTEIFVLPFFIYTQPETALTMLKYRYRNLPGAREKAGHMGFKGALYPWESADKGIETTPPYGYGPSGEQVPILSGLMEHHISADVAWAVWEYWKATGDDGFMASMGVEMLLETARFWVSRAASDDEGRYHVNVVVGPDEYHEGVNDNAYTNVLARWNIKRALEALAWLRELDPDLADALTARLELSVTELFGWRKVIDGYVTGLRPGDAALRAVRRVLRHGRRAAREDPPAAHGRRPDARPRRDAGEQGGQAGRRGDALPRARRRDRRGGDAGQLRLLRAHHLPRQLAQPGHPRRRGGAPARRRGGHRRTSRWLPPSTSPTTWATRPPACTWPPWAACGRRP